MTVAIRIIRDNARTAAFNMAADRYLLERAAGQGTVCLRLYSWSPPAVSLGCMQKPDAILDKDALMKEGVELAFRTTGGRAVLHWNDLTYAFVFPQGVFALGSSINRSYAAISRCLLRGLQTAGITSAFQDSPEEYAASRREMKLACFLSPNRNELMARGKKLVGSAQKRTAAAVLQHGSIPLDGSFRRLPDFLLLSKDERKRQRILLEEKCACVHELNPSIDGGMLSECIVAGFKETLNASAYEKPWGKEETEAITAMASSPGET